MNLLLFDASEFEHGNSLALRGRRCRHLREVLRVVPGDLIRVGQVNGAMGTGRVLSCTADEIKLAVCLDTPPPAANDLELIVALPRPIMLQRILKQGTVLGVRRFHLIRSNRVEKSFFHSPVLQPGKIRELLLEGMEQAMDTHLPDVVVHPRFKPFVEEVLPGLGSGLIAHPAGPWNLPQAYARCSPGRLLMAVGPEGGWSEYEYQCFVEAGFQGFQMGRRILHVDTAVVCLLAQIVLLEELGILRPQQAGVR